MIKSMTPEIQIIEKPDWVSWENIHEVLVKAHASNRAHGINMRKPSLPGEEIKKEIGDDGVMLIAMEGKKVIGTAALLIKSNHLWYSSKPYGYLCFASILPDFTGRGIYGRLCKERERIAIEKGLSGLYIDTHHNNTTVVKIALQNGFHRVDVKSCKDHWNVVLFKWLNGCPYSDFRCWYEFHKRKMIMKVKTKIKSLIK